MSVGFGDFRKPLPIEKLPPHRNYVDRSKKNRSWKLFHFQLSAFFAVDRRRVAVHSCGHGESATQTTLHLRRGVGNPAWFVPAHSVLSQAVQILLLQGFHRRQRWRD